MEISLKQARRLEKAFEELIDKANAGSLAQSRQISVSKYEDFAAAIKSGNAKVFDSLAMIEAFSDARFEIRRQIESAKETSGLNSLINREARNKTVLQHLDRVVQCNVADESELNVEFLRHKDMAATSTVVDTFGGARDSITVSDFLCATKMAEYKKQQRKLKNENTDIVDQCTALNTTTKITLSEKVLTLIAENEL